MTLPWRTVFAAALVGGAISCHHDDDPGTDPTTPTTTTGPVDYTTMDPALAEALDQGLAAAFAGYPNVPGAVVAVRSAEGDYVEAFGQRTIGGPAMPRDAIFDIGSVHKNFKWTLIHKLVEEGVVDLDDEVVNYTVTPALSGARVRDLLNHSAALPDIPHCTGFSESLVVDLTREWTYPEIMDALDSCFGQVTIGTDGFVLWDIESGRLQGFTVGTDASYSSFGPVVGQAIIEVATGQDLRTAMRERILDPLELRDTSFVAYEADPGRLVEAYWDPGVEATVITSAELAMSFSSANASAMYSSAYDLVRYTDAQFSPGPFLSAETQASLTADPLAAPGRRMGLGVISDDHPTDIWWGHTGDAIHGHAAAMLHHAPTQTSVVVLTNLRDSNGQFEPNYALASEALAVLQANR